MKKSTEKILKLLVFPIGKLTLSIPVDDVKKVINLPPLYSSGLNYFAITHGEEDEITVIDLHQKLFKVSSIPDFEDEEAYLVIAKNTMDEEFGVIVRETPTIMDVPFSKIRILPPSYRNSDTLEIASHVTVIEQEHGPITVFILDSDQILTNVEIFA